MKGLFLLFVTSAFYSTGCLGMIDDGTAFLQESLEQLVNYTAYEALDYLNLKKIGSNVASAAYENYKGKLGEVTIYIWL